MRKTAINDDVISTREAAELLGVALRTVQLWVEGGVLPAWKTAGGHRRIARQAVEQLLAERRAALGTAATAPRAPAVPRGAAALQVLVVEDEPDLRKLIVMNLEGWDLPIQVSEAGDGYEALLRLGLQRPDLLVTDLNMPGMDGFRMIRTLRSAGSPLRDLEIVVVTALGADDIAERGGLPAGVQVLTKPVPFDRLESLVRERVAQRAAA